jgi:hypothetical protein
VERFEFIIYINKIYNEIKNKEKNFFFPKKREEIKKKKNILFKRKNAL